MTFEMSHFSQITDAPYSVPCSLKHGFLLKAHDLGHKIHLRESWGIILFLKLGIKNRSRLWDFLERQWVGNARNGIFPAKKLVAKVKKEQTMIMFFKLILFLIWNILWRIKVLWNNWSEKRFLKIKNEYILNFCMKKSLLTYQNRCKIRWGL